MQQYHMYGGLLRKELFSANLEEFSGLYSRKLTTQMRVGEETNRMTQSLQKQKSSTSWIAVTGGAYNESGITLRP